VTDGQRNSARAIFTGSALMPGASTRRITASTNASSDPFFERISSEPVWSDCAAQAAKLDEGPDQECGSGEGEYDATDPLHPAHVPAGAGEAAVDCHPDTDSEKNRGDEHEYQQPPSRFVPIVEALGHHREA